MLFAVLVVISAGAVVVGHTWIEPTWAGFPIPSVDGGGGLFWQVQSTFLAVGFASLAVAAQLFAETPLAIGASRSRVLSYIGARGFLAVGLSANGLIAVEAVWSPSNLGVVVVALWFCATVWLLISSTTKLMDLFGRPSLLDVVVTETLTVGIAARLKDSAARYERANRDVEGLFADEGSALTAEIRGSVSMRVRAPDNRLVLKAVKSIFIRRAMSVLVRARQGGGGSEESSHTFVPPRIHFDLTLGERVRDGQHAFRVESSFALDEESEERVKTFLVESLVFEPEGTVTAVEESLRDVSSLRDTIGSSVRSGSFATAERALEILGTALRGVWVAAPATRDAFPTAPSPTEDLLRAAGDVEQDVILSPRVANIFVDGAMRRAVEAGRTGSIRYVEECLLSFTRMWWDLLRYGDESFEAVRSRIITCVVNIAGYVYSSNDKSDRQAYVARAIWANVQLVKLAIDAKNVLAAQRAAEELGALFEHREGEEARARVRAGQLVLSSWMSYLASINDGRDLDAPELRASLKPGGTRSQILDARAMAGRDESPFNRWQWWELNDTGSMRAQTMQMSGHVDSETVDALVAASGPLPDADDSETASSYRRFIYLLKQSGDKLNPAQEHLLDLLEERFDGWERAEDVLLSEAPISEARVKSIREALRDALDGEPRLAEYIPRQSVPVNEDGEPAVDVSLPILGLNLLVPRIFVVEEVFKQTYADPTYFGQALATGFRDGEDRRIAEHLRQLSSAPRRLTVAAIRDAIASVDEDEAKHHVLFKPFGGMGNLDEWYDEELRMLLGRVTVIETAVLEDEAFFFDSRTTLLSCREPEQKADLYPVPGTTIALGVFEDAKSEGEPTVRIETGEHFVIWRGERPKVTSFRNSAEVTRE
ncbi:hypothetical protein [Microbacterium sp.]|uniref:hypothetical protein n=1 Tax=Microbacterium sp. TaxID=51671 RepID=UPI003563885B